MPAGDLARIGPLLRSGDELVRAAAIRAVGVWKVAALEPRLIELARADATPESIRAAAIESLVFAKNPEARSIIDQFTATGSPPSRQALALAALWELDPKVAAFRTAAWLRRLRPEQADAGANRVVPRARAPWCARSAGLESGRREFTCRHRRRQAGDPPGPRLRPRPAGSDRRPYQGRPARREARKLTDSQMAQLVADVARRGDAARGEAIFRRADMNCLKCHAIAGAGGQVGPSLESIGASAQVDYLIDSLLEPSKNVKENFNAIVVATSDGKVYTGIKLRQTETDLVLRDANDREISIAPSSIEEQGNAGSLMPAGLTDSLTRGELVDLVSFLSQLGKIGPYSVGTDRVFRSWRMLGHWPISDTSAGRSAHDLAGVDLDFQTDPSLSWQPVYTTVSGQLPVAELTLHKLKSAPASLALARTELDVSVAGKIKLDFNAREGLTVWIDGKRIADDARRPGQLYSSSNAARTRLRSRPTCRAGGPGFVAFWSICRSHRRCPSRARKMKA